MNCKKFLIIALLIGMSANLSAAITVSIFNSHIAGFTQEQQAVMQTQTLEECDAAFKVLNERKTVLLKALCMPAFTAEFKSGILPHGINSRNGGMASWRAQLNNCNAQFTQAETRLAQMKTQARAALNPENFVANLTAVEQRVQAALTRLRAATTPAQIRQVLRALEQENIDRDIRTLRSTAGDVEDIAERLARLERLAVQADQALNQADQTSAAGLRAFAASALQTAQSLRDLRVSLEDADERLSVQGDVVPEPARVELTDANETLSTVGQAQAAPVAQPAAPTAPVITLSDADEALSVSPVANAVQPAAQAPIAPAQPQAASQITSERVAPVAGMEDADEGLSDIDQAQTAPTAQPAALAAQPVAPVAELDDADERLSNISLRSAGRPVEQAQPQAVPQGTSEQVAPQIEIEDAQERLSEIGQAQAEPAAQPVAPTAPVITLDDADETLSVSAIANAVQPAAQAAVAPAQPQAAPQVTPEQVAPTASMEDAQERLSDIGQAQTESIVQPAALAAQSVAPVAELDDADERLSNISLRSAGRPAAQASAMPTQTVVSALQAVLEDSEIFLD